MTKQKTIFLSEEGDNYFSRNQSLNPQKKYEFLSSYITPTTKTLEIGCGDGKNLSLFTAHSTAKYVGIDPSEKALQSAKIKYPGNTFIQGTADALPFEDNSFDFIYLGFFLYVVDRNLLPKIVSEVDRCLKDEGFLAITDFDPAFPYNTPYKHYSGMTTFKYDYSKMFSGFPHFSVIESRLHTEFSQIRDDKNWESTKVLLKSFKLCTENLQKVQE